MMTKPTDQLDPAQVSVSVEGPPIIVEDIDRHDFVRYAGASGDFNPIHYSEPYAHDHGYESVFAQGMFTAGIASRFVTDWLGIGALTSFSTRFVSQAWPGDTLEVTGEVVEIDRSGDDRLIVDVEFEVRSDGDQTVLTGTATGEYPEATPD